MRCSMGRHREENALQVEDAELVQLALEDLSAATGLGVRPVDWHLQRFDALGVNYRPLDPR